MKDGKFVLIVAFALNALAMPGRDVRYVSHRGDYADVPEGSMGAYRNSIRFHMDAVKLDVHPSKDGVVFLSHDVTLTRTMGWDVRIPDVDTGEILQHYFKDRVFGSPLWTERLVMLKQALRVLKDRIPEFWVDFKTFSPEFAEKVLTEFDSAGIERSRIVIATDPMGPALAYMRDRHPNIRRFSHIEYVEYPDFYDASFAWGRRFKDLKDLENGIVEFAEKMKLTGVNLSCIPEIATKELVHNIRERGFKVSIAVLNSAREAEWFSDYDNDYVVTGNVRDVRPVLNGASDLESKRKR